MDKWKMDGSASLLINVHKTFLGIQLYQKAIRPKVISSAEITSLSLSLTHKKELLAAIFCDIINERQIILWGGTTHTSSHIEPARSNLSLSLSLSLSLTLSLFPIESDQINDSNICKIVCVPCTIFNVRWMSILLPKYSYEDDFGHLLGLIFSSLQSFIFGQKTFFVSLRIELSFKSAYEERLRLLDFTAPPHYLKTMYLPLFGHILFNSIVVLNGPFPTSALFIFCLFKYHYNFSPKQMCKWLA